MKTFKIALPVQQVLTTLIAEAKVIGHTVIIKSLTQQQPGGLPSIDHSALLTNDSFRAAAVEQIEDEIRDDKELKEKFQWNILTNSATLRGSLYQLS